jgi:hypothetical protein
LPHVSLKSWPTSEVSGMVYVWHDHLDGEPTWDAPSIDEYDDPAFHDAFPHAYARDRLAMHPQFAAENFPDMVHMQYVHGWVETPEPSVFELDGHRARTVFQGHIPTARGPLPVENIGLQFGIGINFARITGNAPSTTIGAFTPIDDTTSMAFISVFVPRRDPGEGAPTGLSAAIARANLDQMMGNSHDRLIFEHMTYQPRPMLLPEEAANYRAYRRWTEQFYPAEADEVADTRATAPSRAARG